MIDLMPIVRAERLVCTARLVIAVTSLIAIIVDAPDSATNRRVTIPLLAVFTVYATVSALLQWRGSVPTLRTRRLSHWADVAVILLLNYASDAITSPFFAFFVFSLVSASIRFGARMALITAGVVLTSYLGLGAYESVMHSMSTSDRTRFLIRTGYLAVIAVLIHYLAHYQERVSSELAQIAAWPRDRADNLEDALQQLLTRAARLFQAKRILLVWEVCDEPWIFAGYYDGRHVTMAQHSPSAVLPVVDESLQRDSFVIREDGRSTVHHRDGAVEVLGHSPIHPKIVEEYQIGTTLSVPFSGDIVAGRLFYLDPPRPTLDSVTLGNIIGRLVGVSIEQQFVTWQLQGAAAAEERLRVARDLHDGVVQSLAGAALHLQILEQLIDTDPDHARASLREIRELVSQDQRELRSYIGNLRPSLSTGDQERSLRDRIIAAAERIQRERSVQVKVEADPYIDTISEGMKTETYNIVREAITNAAKHAAPTIITVQLALHGDRVTARISDDGRGFPFHGQYDLETLRAMQRGPMTLKERVGALSGDLLLESGMNGTTLHIDLPRSLAEVKNGDSRSAGR